MKKTHNALIIFQIIMLLIVCYGCSNNKELKLYEKEFCIKYLEITNITTESRVSETAKNMYTEDNIKRIKELKEILKKIEELETKKNAKEITMYRKWYEGLNYIMQFAENGTTIKELDDKSYIKLVNSVLGLKHDIGYINDYLNIYLDEK